MTSTTTTTKCTLETTNGLKYDFDLEALQKMSKVVADQMQCCSDTDDTYQGVGVEIENIDAFKFINDYCVHYKTKEVPTYNRTDKIPEWEQAFLDSINISTRFDMMNVTDFVAIKPLLNLLITHQAKQHSGTIEEIAKMYGVDASDQPTEAERIEIRKEYPWCMDI